MENNILKKVIKACLGIFNPRNERPFNLITVKGELVNSDINLDKTSEILNLEDKNIFLNK